MGPEDKKTTWDLIAKMLTDEASPEERDELQKLLKENPELHYPMQTISDLWKSTEDPDGAVAEAAYSRHLDRMGVFDAVAPTARNRRRQAVIGGLSVLLLATGLTIWLPGRSPHAAVKPVAAGPVAAASEFYTANGFRSRLTLPDGTLVWLNAGSRLSYAKNFNITRREISLTGEAFFDVAKNNQKPFLIHTDRIDIQVLGTSFDVKSYPSDKTTETTLIRGSIEVSIKERPSEKIILKPHEKLVVGGENGPLKLSNARRTTTAAPGEPLISIRRPTYEQATGTIIETSWVDNKLAFKDESFGDLARRLERWYGITIQFSDPALEQLEFTGSFKEETVRQALDALRLTAPFHYDINANLVTISK